MIVRSLSFLCFLIVVNLCTSSTTTPDYSTSTSDDDEQSTEASVAPLEFPDLGQNYTFVDNSSIRENLASHSKNDTEIEDLLVEDESTISPFFEDASPNPSEIDEDIQEKGEVGFIEDGEDTEDQKFIFNSLRDEITISVINAPDEKNNYSLIESHTAVILASTFVVIAIIAYLALISYRRYLEDRYGSREMLVTSDFMDPDDLKHFSI